MADIAPNLTDNTAELEAILEILQNKAAGSIQLPELTNPGSAEHLLLDKELIDGQGNKIIGEMPIISLPQPNISVNANGVISVMTPPVQGYINASFPSFASKQLSTQAGRVIIPKPIPQIAVDTGVYTTGQIVIDGDDDLIASNIKNGVSIFGVEGTYGKPSHVKITCFIQDSGAIMTIRGSVRYIDTSGNIQVLNLNQQESVEFDVPYLSAIEILSTYNHKLEPTFTSPTMPMTLQSSRHSSDDRQYISHFIIRGDVIANLYNA